MHRSLLRLAQAARTLVAMLILMPASALAAQSSSVVLRLHFRTVATHVDAFPIGDAPYVAFRTSRDLHTFVLLNDATGKRTQVTPCGRRRTWDPWAVFGSGWLAFDCGPGQKWRFRLYNVHTRHCRRLLCDRACKRYSNDLTMTAVGSKWLLVSIPPHQWCGPADPIHYACGPTVYLYYAAATGEPGFPHPRPNDVLDLNSATITSAVCDQVALPAGSRLIPRPLAVDRGFAFVQSQNGIYVQRCGTSRQTYLATNAHLYDISPFWGTTNEFFGNQHAAGLCCGYLEGATPVFNFSGFFLPSMIPFTATGIPKYSPAALLGPRHLYVWSATDFSLIAATFPSKPAWASQLTQDLAPAFNGRW